MRVISGKYRSLPLKALAGEETRPTLEKVKQAVFNHLGNLKGKTFLDLFAGSGAIGIEALSKDAKMVIFNENNLAALRIIARNLDFIKAENSNFEIYRQSYDKLLKTTTDKFDYIYLDPPFASDYFIKCLKLIAENNLLKTGGEIIIESEDNEDLSNQWFKIRKTAKYGRIKITYLNKE